MIARRARRGARVIVAGSDATDAPEAYLRAGAEVVLSSARVSPRSTALVQRLDEDDPSLDRRSSTAGLSGWPCLPGRRRLARVRERRADRSRSAYPELPAWDLVDVERYRAVWMKAHGYFSLNMAASRGCPFRCTWCAKPIWGNQYAQRNAAAVAAEMAYLKRHFRPDHIWFADDIFGFRPAWVTRFAQRWYAARRRWCRSPSRSAPI